MAFLTGSHVGTRFGLILLLSTVFFHTGCERAVGPDEDEHEEFNRVEISIRATNEVIAIWTEDDGWNVDELMPIPVDGGGGEPMWADGPRASLTIRIFDSDGDELPMGTISQDPDSGERQCTEYSARYAVHPDASQDVIAWPPIIEGGLQTQFVDIDGERVAIFHCDHVHIYPGMEGETEVQILLWHVDHADESTGFLTLRVTEARGEED